MRENLSRGNKSVVGKRSKRKIEYATSSSSLPSPLSSSFLFYVEDPNLDSNNDEYAKEKRVRTEGDDGDDDENDFSYDNDNYEHLLTDEVGGEDTPRKEGIYALTNNNSNNNFSYFNHEFTSEVEHSNRLERLLKDALHPSKSDHLNNMISALEDRDDSPSSQYYTNNDRIDPLNQPISQVLSANELLMKCMQEKHESDAFLNYISQMR